MTAAAAITWYQFSYNICDTLTIRGDEFFLSCTFWQSEAATKRLPFLAQFDIDTFTYVHTYYMGFNQVFPSNSPNYFDRHHISQAILDANNNIYFYGITRQLYYYAPTNRFSFVNVFLENDTFGSHYAAYLMLDDFSSGPYASG